MSIKNVTITNMVHPDELALVERMLVREDIAYRRESRTVLFIVGLGSDLREEIIPAIRFMTSCEVIESDLL